MPQTLTLDKLVLNDIEYTSLTSLDSTQLSEYHIFDQKLKAGDISASDQFGESSAISPDGTYLITGAISEDLTVTDSGGAYVFLRDGDTWTQQAKLKASDAEADDLFGTSVAISRNGNYAVVGAPAHDTNTGNVYVYSRSGATWTQVKILSGEIAGDYFGQSVAISETGEFIIVGAYGNGGTAYVYTGSAWEIQATIAPTTQISTDKFGYTVAISDDATYAMVGAYGETTSTGAAYIYIRSGSSWSLQQKLTAADGATNEKFGTSVSISPDGGYAAVSSLGASSVMGAVYVFVRTDTTWTQQQKLVADDVAALTDLFGQSVKMSLYGNYIVVGAPGITTNTGHAYIFVKSNLKWTQKHKLLANDGATNAAFGYTCDLSYNGEYIICSANVEDATASNSGALYTYTAKPYSSVISQTLATSTGAIAPNQDTDILYLSATLTGAITITLPIGTHEGRIFTVVLTNDTQNIIFSPALPSGTITTNGYQVIRVMHVKNNVWIFYNV